MVIYSMSQMYQQLSFGPVKVSKMGDKAIIVVPKALRRQLLGRRVLVTVTIIE